MKHSMVAGLLIGAALVSALTGCGGSESGLTKIAPTTTTRARVRQLFTASSQVLTQAGYTPARLRVGLDGYTNTDHPAAPVGVTGAVNNQPMIAAFFRRNQAATTNNHSAANQSGGVSRQIAVDPVPLPPVPTNGFYYDYYLGLWVSTNSGPGQCTYTLFVDQAKTQPAGSIQTLSPADFTVFPQTYHSTYAFTAGYLTGSHGDSLNVANADGSSTATYNDTYADASTDKGASTQTAQGDYTWIGRTDAPDGSWTTVRGGFRADGSGGTHIEMSDGYVADYVYNADGSGHARITGPDPGLPVTITYDPYSYATVTYADGTTDVIQADGFSGGGTTSGSSSGNTGTGNVVPPAPTPAGAPTPTGK